jgi:copper resistance protein C
MSPAPKAALLAACALIAPLAAGAHTHLLRSTPAAGSVLAAPPPRLRLDFSEPALLTALTLERSGDAARRPLTPQRGAPQASFAVDLPPLAAGHYLVRWRALSADNHVAFGSFGFTLRVP